MKIKLEIELEIDEPVYGLMQLDEMAWFKDSVLLNTQPGRGLVLHSNYIGDELGPVKVLRIISVSI